MITFLNFGTPFNASKRDKAPKPSNYIVVTCHQRLKFRIFSTKYLQYIKYRWYPTWYWASIINQWEFQQNIDNISEISTIYRFRGEKVKWGMTRWKPVKISKIYQWYIGYIGKYIGYIIEKVCQNIKDISTIYRIYRIYCRYIGEILDIF